MPISYCRKSICWAPCMNKPRDENDDGCSYGQSDVRSLQRCTVVGRLDRILCLTAYFLRYCTEIIFTDDHTTTCGTQVLYCRCGGRRACVAESSRHTIFSVAKHLARCLGRFVVAANRQAARFPPLWSARGPRRTLYAIL